MRKGQETFKTLENAFWANPQLRALNTSETFTVFLQIYHLGLNSFSILAQIAVYETVRRASAIESVKSVASRIDPIVALAASTPNLKVDGGNSDE